MKYVKICAIALFLFSCSVNQKSMLNNYWNELVKAESEKEETEVLEKLADYLQERQVSFTIYKDINGKLTDLANVAPADSSYPVTIKFQEAGSSEEIIKSGWHPKNIDNTFFLYRE
ncbi:hypothetical protein [Niabella ginsengisoli]|uniref:DUF3887 domain-containing protein n=1 Tax=Niabella ginsengisoli TaxID=522298 RepID=A0ABS9SM56_9BACT|nr:hypothetical protein [Niabella ginsengisoli]MCH5599239.1 hypothetical protein [Niabella ginsengisoli]